MRTYPSGSITARPIFRLECLFELGLADATGAAGVDGVKQVRHLLLWRRASTCTGDRMKSRFRCFGGPNELLTATSDRET